MPRFKGEQTIKLPALPPRLGEAVQEAVKLTQKVLNEKGVLYKAFSEDWHEPKEGRCRICLIGGLLAGKYDDPLECITPDDMDSLHRFKALAIDCVRLGKIEQAIMHWKHKPPFPNDLAMLKKLGCDEPITWFGKEEWEQAHPLITKRGRLYSDLKI